MDHREFLQRLGALAKSPWPAPKAAQGGRPYGAAYPAFDRSCRRVDGTAALLVGLGPFGGLAVDICRSWQLPGLDAWHLLVASRAASARWRAARRGRTPLPYPTLPTTPSRHYFALDERAEHFPLQSPADILYLVIGQHDAITLELADIVGSYAKARGAFVVGLILRPSEGLPPKGGEQLMACVDALVDFPTEQPPPGLQQANDAIAVEDILRACDTVTAMHASHVRQGVLDGDMRDLIAWLQRGTYLRARPFLAPALADLTPAFLKRQVELCLAELKDDPCFADGLLLALHADDAFTVGQFDRVGCYLRDLPHSMGWRKREPLTLLTLTRQQHRAAGDRLHDTQAGDRLPSALLVASARSDGSRLLTGHGSQGA